MATLILVCIANERRPRPWNKQKWARWEPIRGQQRIGHIGTNKRSGNSFCTSTPLSHSTSLVPSRGVFNRRYDFGGDLYLGSILLAELYYGAMRSGAAHRTANLALIARVRQQFVSLSFDDRAAEEYGKIRADWATAGTIIGPNDLLIAAIARTNRNTRARSSSVRPISNRSNAREL